jgi:hypothetical protein
MKALGLNLWVVFWVASGAGIANIFWRVFWAVGATTNGQRKRVANKKNDPLSELSGISSDKREDAAASKLTKRLGKEDVAGKKKGKAGTKAGDLKKGFLG